MKNYTLKNFGLGLIFVLCLFQNVKAQTFDWAKNHSGTLSEVANDVVSDAAGNVYTVGYFNGTVDFDPSAATFNLTSAGAQDFFISKLDPSGALVWAYRFGSTSNDVANGIALDQSGNILITGGFYGNFDVDPGPGVFNLGNMTGSDIFVLKLTTDATFVWAKQFGGNNDNQMGNKVVTDAAGNVYSTGTTIGQIDFDPGTGTAYPGVTPSTNTNCYISKLDANGNYVWAKVIGNSSNAAYGMDIAVSSSQEVYTSGYFISSVDFDPGAGTTSLNASSGTAAFIHKLNANGTFAWVRSIGTETLGNEAALGILLYGNKVISTGYFTGTCDFDPGTGTTNIASFGGADAFVQALDNTGTYLWAKQLGGTAEDWSYSIASDGAAGIYTTGFFTGTADFDPSVASAPLVAVGLRDVFISKLDYNGNYAWAQQLGGTGTDTGYGMHVTPAGTVYTVGYYGASGDFDPTAGTSTLAFAGGNDIFIQKMSQCLTPLAPVNASSGLQAICNNSSASISVNGYGTVGWYTASTGGTYLGATNTYTTTNLTATTTFYAQDSLCGPGSRTPVTVTVLPAITDQSVSAAASTICSSGSTTINLGSSQTGVNYYLRNDANNAVISGPVAGTGSAISLPTGTVSSTTTYNVIGIASPTNGALDLDGSNDYVDAGTNNRGITSVMTISARVKTSVNGTSQFIVSKYLSGSLGYYLLINATGYASIQGRDVAGAIKTSGNSTTMVADNQWHDITGVVRTTGWEIWIDGVLQSSSPYSLGATGLGTSAPLLIGQFGGGYTPADIDRVAVWNTSLTPALITSYATSCLLGNEANLTAYFPMSDAAGTVATDFSSTAMNGTLTNMTAPGCWITASIPLCLADCIQEMSNVVTVTITTPPAQPTITPSGPTTFCSGGSVTLNAPNSAGYQWSNGATTQSINVTTTGTYTVIVGAPGCQSVASTGVTVTVNALPSQPTITPGGSTMFCQGGSVNLSVPTSNAYLWSNGATTQSVNVTTSGSYTVQVTNANGCQSVASNAITVTVNALPSQPNITPGGPTTFCQGGTVTLAAPASTGYLWSDGSMSSSINVSSTGTYTVQVTNAQGCQSIASAPLTVTVHSLPNAPIISPNGPLTFCQGGTVNLASSAGVTYLWSNGTTNFSVDVTTSGSYSVQITDPNGCLSPASAVTTVTVNPNPIVSLGAQTNPTSCVVANGSIQVSGTGTGNLSWTGTSSGSMNGVTLPATISSLTNGAYTITFTNGNGCSSNTINGVLTAPSAPPAPTITAGGGTVLCAGQSVILNSTAGNTYLWSNGETTSSIVADETGSYSVSITDASGCTSPSSNIINVTVHPQPTISAGTLTNPTSCVFQDGSIEVNGTGASDLSWSGGAVGSVNGVTLPYTIPNLGQGSYSIVHTDANGCNSATLVVNLVAPGAPAAPTISADGPINFCEGGSVTLTSSNGASYLWSNGETTSSIVVDQDGAFSVIITDAGGCTSPSSAVTNVNEDAIPLYTVSVTNNVITADQTSAGYQWINCATNQPISGAQNQSFTPVANGSYAVIVTNGACSDTSVCTVISTIDVKELEMDLNLQVYPNPGYDVVTVTSNETIETVSVYSVTGEIVARYSTAQFNVSHYSRGVYLLKVQTPKGDGVLRLIVE